MSPGSGEADPGPAPAGDPPFPILKAIAAMAPNRVIGRDGTLPWRLPEDLKWFRRLTLGHPVLMGRRTWESLPKPLPGRRNLVLSRSWAADGRVLEGAEVLASPDDLAVLDPPAGAVVWVIGGAEIYRAVLPRCDELYLSLLRDPHEGDVRFPPFEEGFTLAETVAAYPEFELRRYVRRRPPP